MREINSLEPEVVGSQPGVVNLQNDPVVVNGGRQDLQNTEGNQPLEGPQAWGAGLKKHGQDGWPSDSASSLPLRAGTGHFSLGLSSSSVK